jgi:alanine racemase
VQQGQAIGYNATYVAPHDMEIAVINMGYADGYLRSFSAPSGQSGGTAQNGKFPLVGRVSMDLIMLNVDAQPDIREGDWVSMDYDLQSASRVSGLSQYELLTQLGSRHDRIWA